MEEWTRRNMEGRKKGRVESKKSGEETKEGMENVREGRSGGETRGGMKEGRKRKRGCVRRKSRKGRTSAQE